MSTKSLHRMFLLGLALAVTTGCDDTPLTTGGGGGGFRIVWPSASADVEDAETFAVAIFPLTTAEPASFTASVDGGPEISGLRNGSDSVVAFPLAGLTDGSHTISVRAGAGASRFRSFTVSLAPRPSITDVDPDTAVLGADQQITISGTGFIASSQQMRVYLNGVRLPIVQASSTTELVASVDGTGLRTGLLSVATTVTAANRRISRELIPFRVVGGDDLPDEPQVMLADPSAAPNDAPVILYGKNFGAGDIPSFNSLESTPILPLGAQSLGFGVGLVQFGLTIVPPVATTQDGVVAIGSGTSFPFFVR